MIHVPRPAAADSWCAFSGQRKLLEPQRTLRTRRKPLSKPLCSLRSLRF